jgi:hypothetical protein
MKPEWSTCNDFKSHARLATTLHQLRSDYMRSFGLQLCNCSERLEGRDAPQHFEVGLRGRLAAGV